MNDSQKRYTVLQIDKYKSEVARLDKNLKYCGFTMVCSMIPLLAFSDYPLSTFVEWALIKFIEIGCVVFEVAALKELISNIAKKAGLEGMIANLEYQLEIDDPAHVKSINEKHHGGLKL